MNRESLSITDNRTGKSYQVPIENGAIRATVLREIKTGPDDFGLMSYDPAFLNTASCTSRITMIDGDKGILEYRGYPIEQLAEILLSGGRLPVDLRRTSDAGATRSVDSRHHQPHADSREHQEFIDGFHHDAHPMGILMGTVAALSTFYPDRGTSATTPRANSRFAGLSPRCQRWRPSPTGTASDCGSLTRTMT